MQDAFSFAGGIVMKILSNLFIRNSFSSFMLTVGVVFLFISAQVQAIPAFARKYQANCALCHNNEPRLAPFGQKFLENGYQLPGTEDGAETAKMQLEGEQGPVTLDKLSNMMAVRIRADIEKASFKQLKDDMKTEGVNEQTNVEMPRIINIFFGGTATKNLSYFLEAEYNTMEAHGGDTALKFERTFLQFSNVGRLQGAANIKVGVFDPSSLFAFPTHRQQMNPILPIANSDKFPPQINRIPILPLAFSSKLFGMTTGNAYIGGEGHAILPFQPFLYNAPFQKGVSIHGRPMGAGSGFMYQIGTAINDRATVDSTRKNRYDSYLMGRYDFSVSAVDAQIAAFVYNAPNAALAALAPNNMLVTAMDTTDINRVGIGGRAQWWQFDVYAAYVQDMIERPTFMMAPLNTSVWDTKGSGFSGELDWRFHKKWMLGVRYDQMSPGGLSKLPMGADPARTKLNVNASFFGAILKYYMSPNIGLYLRTHINLEGTTRLPDTTGQAVQINAFDGSEHPATNLRNVTTFGIDMAF